jgi:hypothetical protein
MLAAMINSKDSNVTFRAWLDRFIDRLVTVSAAATLLSIPFLVHAVFVHPVFDGIVTIHPVVLVLVVATFTGFGFEALLHLVDKVIGKAFRRALPGKLIGFFTVYSAVTIAGYGMLYQLHHLPVLIAVTGTLVLAGLLHWALTRPHLTGVGTAVHALAAVGLAVVDTLAAAALFVGWPALPTVGGVAAVVFGVAATAAWLWLSGSLRAGEGSSSSTLTGGGSLLVLRWWAPRWLRDRVLGASEFLAAPPSASSERSRWSRWLVQVVVIAGVVLVLIAIPARAAVAPAAGGADLGLGGLFTAFVTVLLGGGSRFMWVCRLRI